MWCNDTTKLASIAGHTGTSLNQKALGRVATYSRGSVCTEVLGAVHTEFQDPGFVLRVTARVKRGSCRVGVGTALAE